MKCPLCGCVLVGFTIEPIACNLEIPRETGIQVRCSNYKHCDFYKFYELLELIPLAIQDI